MAGLWLRVGSVTATAGSSEITGSGTTWTDPETGPKKAQLMLIVDAAGKQWVGEVDSASSDTSLTTVEAYSGETGSGLTYAIDTFRSNTAADLGARIANFLATYNQYIAEWDDRLDLIPSQLSQAQSSATAASDSASDSASSAVSAKTAAEAARDAAQSSATSAAAYAVSAGSAVGWRVAFNAKLSGVRPGELLAQFVCDRPGVLPKTLTNSRFRLTPAPGATANFTIHVNSNVVATIQAVAGQQICSITPIASSDTHLSADDVVEIRSIYTAGAKHLSATICITQ